MTTRRQFLHTSALATMATALRPRLSGDTVGCTELVSTALGRLRGECFPGGRVFRGVPFAAPPVGKLRFRPPMPAAPRMGERDATHFGPSALQTGEPGVTHSEDCLYLNLWTPAGKGPFPVYMWIHGGGFTGGHSFEPVFDGAQFAREGVVCVTVGYRLGVFGFLDLQPALGAEYAGSANNGLRDLVAALGWVRAHVADFGGDPERVTVGGESAGAKLTDILMGVPEAKPLFRQMISESGGAERVWPRSTAQAVGQGFTEAWQQKSGLDRRSLLAAEGDSLIAVQKPFLDAWPQHFPLRPEIDGQLLPALPVAGIASGSSRGKRLLIGTNRDESALFVGPHPAHDATAEELGNMPVSAFMPVYGRYAELYPELTVEQRRIRALTAEEYWIPSIRVADAHTRAGGQAWMYRLDFTETAGRLAGYAYHSLDVGLVWDRPHTGVGDDVAEAALAVQMHAAWVAFIQGKAPAADRLPEWPAYTADRRATMVLNQTSRVEQRPQEAELRVWNDFLPTT